MTITKKEMIKNILAILITDASVEIDDNIKEVVKISGTNNKKILVHESSSFQDGYKKRFEFDLEIYATTKVLLDELEESIRDLDTFGISADKYNKIAIEEKFNSPEITDDGDFKCEDLEEPFNAGVFDVEGSYAYYGGFTGNKKCAFMIFDISSFNELMETTFQLNFRHGSASSSVNTHIHLWKVTDFESIPVEGEQFETLTTQSIITTDSYTIHAWQSTDITDLVDEIKEMAEFDEFGKLCVFFFDETNGALKSFLTRDYTERPYLTVTTSYPSYYPFSVKINNTLQESYSKNSKRLINIESRW